MSINPTDFYPSQAWLLFQLNESPVCTVADDNFNILTIMDVARGVIWAMQFVAYELAEPSEFEIRKLSASAKSEADKMPHTLFIARERELSQAIKMAKNMRIEVLLENEETLNKLTQEAREGLSAHVSSTSTRPQ